MITVDEESCTADVLANGGDVSAHISDRRSDIMDPIALVQIDDTMTFAQVVHMVWSLHVETLIHNWVNIALISVFDFV